MLEKQKTLNAAEGNNVRSDNVKLSNFYFEKLIM